MIGEHRQEYSALQGAGMNSAEGERFDRADKLMNAMLIIEKAGAGLSSRVGPRPIRYPPHHGGVPAERRLRKGSVILAQLRQTIGSGEENKAAAAKESLCLHPAFVQGTRQVRKATGAGQHHHLLAYFKAFQHEANKL